MSDQVWRRLAATACTHSDAVRLACILEATAPKVGNVHPTARFSDLSYADFVTAANVTAEAFSGLRSGQSWAATIALAVSNCVAATRTNVNLGIVLLLAPLVASEPDWQHGEQTSLPDSCEQWRCEQWQARISSLLDELDLQQGAVIASAISAAGAGGLANTSLGEDHPLDVLRDDITTYDLLEAMRIAAPGDRIARQYAGDFHDLFHVVIPTLQRCVSECGDLLTGIANAHIALIAAEGDSLISRKCGDEKSAQVASLARACWHAINHDEGPAAAHAVQQLDSALRGQGNRLNPGTTADLLAAATYVLLRLF